MGTMGNKPVLFPEHGKLGVRGYFGERKKNDGDWIRRVEIDDRRKFRGLHSVSAYGHGPVYIYRSMPAGVAKSQFSSCVRVEVAVLGCPS